jgi:glycosyltransferase involved in cell wall biosynthesis
MIMKSIALIADAYPPMRSSAAIQLKDLASEFVEQGYEITIILPDSTIHRPWNIEYVESVRICRLKTLKTKDIPYFRRAINELLCPLLMIFNYQKSPLAFERWDGVVWYSPSIFFGAFISHLKKISGCKTYLILRDIFPKWALDLGLMSKGIPYYFFRMIEKYQYSIADSIGVQSPSNLSYFSSRGNATSAHVEVLHNWLSDSELHYCSINLSSTSLVNRKIFVYAGNIGVAQGIETFVDLAKSMIKFEDVGILLVGRGSEFSRLQQEILKQRLNNILVMNEIDPSEIPGLYKQCHVGLVVLDPRHQTHNIPGKFLSYMRAGLPVLARVNSGNDLISLVKQYEVGYAFAEGQELNISNQAKKILEDLNLGKAEIFRSNAKNLSATLFSTRSAVEQITLALDRN